MKHQWPEDLPKKVPMVVIIRVFVVLVEQAVDQRVELFVIWDAEADMTSV